uniref:Ig-like domain-containing protein n=1 Tax=Gasterosteus aculeatus aculeatus TaxID=481459 RepID=A0AAQ4S783_GASAC
MAHAAAHRNSSLVQPLCVSPQRTQSPDHTQQHSGGVAPTFVKCLHDVSTLNGQLVVLECRLRGTPPLQVMWYREDEQVLDSDDFRILRKKACSGSVPEELCTLVITEAFPEDSGLFQCVALNPFGRVSCSAVLEVYNDLEEQLEAEAAGQQEEVPPLRRKEAAFQHETASFGESADDFPPELPDSMTLPPPEWPDSPVEDNKPVADFPQPANHSFEEPFGRSEEVRALSSGGQRSPGITVGAYTPSPPPPTQVKEQSHTPMFSPTKLSFPSGGPTMNLSDLPSFTPSVFPPSAFNYERPRHFIQSQAAFQAPSYDSVLKEAQENQNSSQQNLGSFQNSPNATETQSGVNMTSAQRQSFSQTQSVSESLSQSQAQLQSLSLSQSQAQSQAQSKTQVQSQSHTQAQSQAQSKTQVQIQTRANGMGKSSSSISSPISPLASSGAPPQSSPAPILSPPASTIPSSLSLLPRTTMRSTITLTPSIPSATGMGSATLPANQDAMSAPAAYLCSVLPSQSAFSPFSSSKLSPNSNLPHFSTSPSRSPIRPPQPSPPHKGPLLWYLPPGAASSSVTIPPWLPSLSSLLLLLSAAAQHSQRSERSTSCCGLLAGQLQGSAKHPSQAHPEEGRGSSAFLLSLHRRRHPGLQRRPHPGSGKEAALKGGQEENQPETVL